MRSAPESDRSSVASPRARSEYFNLAEFRNRATVRGILNHDLQDFADYQDWESAGLSNPFKLLHNLSLHEINPANRQNLSFLNLRNPENRGLIVVKNGRKAPRLIRHCSWVEPM
jgi:hypothetical protein